MSMIYLQCTWSARCTTDKSKRRSLRGNFLEGDLAVITYSQADSFGNGKQTAQEK